MQQSKMLEDLKAHGDYLKAHSDYHCLSVSIIKIFNVSQTLLLHENASQAQIIERNLFLYLLMVNGRLLRSAFAIDK